MDCHCESPGPQLANFLNRDCQCIEVDTALLRASLTEHLQASGAPASLIDLGDFPFAGAPVFVWRDHIEQMAQAIRAIEAVAATPGFRNDLLAVAPISARKDFGTRGVFCSYDFHLGADGPRLIEINTNAGGVLLSLYLAAAQKACCPQITALFSGQADFSSVERSLVDMFREEWRLQRGNGVPGTIAIVDVEPPSQPLYNEFLLFQSLFRRHGIDAIVAGPDELRLRDGKLRVGERSIDLVYNRLTDFYLLEGPSASLLDAYRNGAAVITPAPFHYALLADKRNLPVLADARRLRSMQVDETLIEILHRYIPPAVAVTESNAADLWARRKEMFFKPRAGFGGRGAYRGAKMTRRVWRDILDADYIAQSLVAPSERRILVNGEERALKMDIRCVTYQGRIQHVGARLYQGQTTNLRTRGGGLASVFAAP